MNMALLIVLAVSVAYLAYRRSLIFLQIAQQDEYSPARLFAWYKDNLAFDRRFTLISLTILAVAYFTKYYALASSLAIAAISLLTFFTVDPRADAKLKLNLTARALRILRLHLVLLLVVLVCIIVMHGACQAVFLLVPAIVFIQLLPFILMLAIKILKPFEARINQSFIDDAKRIVAETNPFTIGVTGSYGKTSVKNALAEVMNVTLGSTFYPVAGVNTEMGIVAEIRRKLSNNHRYAVTEMAAYRQGSIAKLCDLMPPKLGIVTAIGRQHLERFGSLDVTYKAKTELAQAVADDGILIFNADNQLSYKASKEFRNDNTYIYGLKDIAGVDKLDTQAKNITYDLSGTAFELHHRGKSYLVKTKLLGEAAVSNLLAVFTAAVALGANPDLVIAHFANLKPVKNRLQLEKIEECYYLHDAYNSNEVGFAAAIELMEALPASRRIIMTPGVIELGAEQFELNKQIAAQASDAVDHIIVVGDVNRDAFIAGVVDAQKLIVVDRRDQAFAELAKLKIPDALILIENDLTDFHEANYKF